MLDLLKKNILIGIGLATMTQSKIKEMGKKLAEESKLSQAEGEKFVDEIMKQAEDTKNSLEQKISEIVQKNMSSMKLPCNMGFQKMESELKDIKASIANLEKIIAANCSKKD